MTGWLTFDRLKWLSFTHSTIYTCLLFFWLAPGFEGATAVFGWLHGIGWICMSLLAITAYRRRLITVQLALLIAVVGGVGPYAGSIGCVVEQRRRATGSTQPVAG